MNWVVINLFSLGAAWFMDIDLGDMDWAKWPATISAGTVFYAIYNFYNSKRANDRVDFDAVGKQLNEIIKLQKEEIALLKNEIKELKSKK